MKNLINKEDIAKKLFNLNRTLIKKRITNNLGKVVEDDEKITCYVKQNKCKKEKYNYTIACFGITKKNQNIAEKYHLNKPICYVIDGISLDKDSVNIFGYNDCEVIIRNCTFDMGLHISINGKCTLENTFIRELHSLSINANELLLKNMDIRNHLKFAGAKLQIMLRANDKIEINNSYIGKIEENTKVLITAPKQIEIYNSKISGDVVECQSDKIISGNKSSIEATEKVNLKTNEFYQINITSPSINYNGNTIDTANKSVILKRTKDGLKIKRFELINLLKKMKKQCEEINGQKVYEYRDRLSKDHISRVLKNNHTH